jgi:hypothetical protein
MGLNLTLLPLWGPEDLNRTNVLCRNRLSFDTDYEVFLQLNGFDGKTKPTIKVNPIPAALWIETYEEEGIRKRRTDKLGEEITFVYAEQLKTLNVSNSSPLNKAIVAFLQHLPNNTPILILWE